MVYVSGIVIKKIHYFYFAFSEKKNDMLCDCILLTLKIYKKRNAIFAKGTCATKIEVLPFEEAHTE